MSSCGWPGQLGQELQLHYPVPSQVFGFSGVSPAGVLLFLRVSVYHPGAFVSYIQKAKELKLRPFVWILRQIFEHMKFPLCTETTLPICSQYVQSFDEHIKISYFVTKYAVLSQNSIHVNALCRKHFTSSFTNFSGLEIRLRNCFFSRCIKAQKF